MKNKITFVIPSRNNLEFLQLAYKSIRNLKTNHEILVLNDASTDGTEKWVNNLQHTDKNLIIYHVLVGILLLNLLVLLPIHKIYHN